MAKTDLLKRARQALPLLIFLAGMLPILLHLGTAGLFETSEARYASVARQMIDSGDWLTPVQNGLKHLTKPPVTYWLSALGMQIFGINEFGARFFLAIAAGLTALGTFLIGRLFFGTPGNVVFQATAPALALFTLPVLPFCPFQNSPSGRRQTF